MVNYFDHVGKEPTGINDCKELLELLSALGLASSLPTNSIICFYLSQKNKKYHNKEPKKTELTKWRLLFSHRLSINPVTLWTSDLYRNHLSLIRGMIRFADFL